MNVSPVLPSLPASGTSCASASASIAGSRAPTDGVKSTNAAAGLDRRQRVQRARREDAETAVQRVHQRARVLVGGMRLDRRLGRGDVDDDDAREVVARAEGR